MMRHAFVVLIALCLPVLGSAQGTSDFTIQIFGAEDTTPPTTPTITAAAPVAPSQIDITWSTSTDNHTVFGYVVYRDGTPIATTTQVTYSDTGLSASTTYSYEVAAFDGVPNYSTTSAAVATTTPDIVVPPPVATTTPEQGAGGTIARVVVSTFDLEVGVATATMQIDTNQVSRMELRLGMTSSYEQSYIVGNTFKRSHTLYINDLLPGTTYYYELIGYTPSGAQTRLRQGSFTTETNELPASPTNVSSLTAVQQGDDVLLTYDLPSDFPSNGVIRVVRNHLVFPQFLSDGLVVYEGVAERVVDRGVFTEYDRAFYTVFVIDPNGLVSSGAVTIVTDDRSGTSAPEIPQAESSGGSQPVPDASSTPADGEAASSSTVKKDPPALVSLDGFPELSDFTVEQAGQISSFSSSTITVTGVLPFTVSVPADVITGEFKTIVVTLTDPQDADKRFSFLLRLNGDQSAYSAVIASLAVAGRSSLVVEVFDYDTRVISRYETKLVFTTPNTATTTRDVWYWRLQAWLWGFALLVPVLVLLLVWLAFSRRDRIELEDNEPTQSQ